MAAKSSDWRPGPTVCRCCFAEGCYKDISTEYFWMGKREVYAEMLLETFDVSILYAQTGGPNSNSRLICEPCISRLRDACDFKRQVVECERVFHQQLAPATQPTLDIIEEEPLVSTVKLEQVKVEVEAKLSDDDEFDDRAGFPDDDDDDLDDEPLTKLATKIPKKESVDLMDLLDNAKPEKRKSTTKVKASPAKKTKKKETAKASTSKAVAKPAEKKNKGPTCSESEPLLSPVKKRNKAVMTTGEKEMIVNAFKHVRKTWPEDKPQSIVTMIKNTSAIGGASYRSIQRVLKDYKEKEDNTDPARLNAETLVRYATAYPFRVNDKSLLCVYCHELYDDPIVFRRHMDADHATNFSIKVAFHSLPKSEFIKADCTTLRCRLCAQPYTDLDSIAKHLKEMHEKRINLSGKLGVMPYVFKSKGVYNCAVCEEKFPSLFHLNRHTVTHFLSYVCHVCGSSYIATTGLLRHVRTKHQEYQVSCKRCAKVFPTMEAKERHRRTEKSCLPYCCPHCSERFLHWKTRKQHMETAHGKQDKAFRCADCNINFTVASAYYEHFKLQHSNDCAVCKHCGLKFLSMYRLKRHLKRHNL